MSRNIARRDDKINTKVELTWTPSVFCFAKSTLSLRLGHATALTVPRTVIHYRVAATLPSRREAVLVRRKSSFEERKNEMNFGLPQIKRSDGIRRSMQDQFGGYNHTAACRDGQIYDMKNMCSDHFPKLSSRKRRVKLKDTGLKIKDILARDGVLYIAAEDNADSYARSALYTLNIASGALEKQVSDLSSGDKELTYMQDRLLIYPDGYYYDGGAGVAPERQGSLRNENEKAIDVKEILLPGEGANVSGSFQNLILVSQNSYDETTEEVGGKYIAIRISDEIDAEWVTSGHPLDPYATFTSLQIRSGSVDFSTAEGKVYLYDDNYNVIVELQAIYRYSNITYANYGWYSYVLCSYGEAEKGLLWDVIKQKAVRICGYRTLPYLSNVFVSENRVWGNEGNMLHVSGQGKPEEFEDADMLSTSPWWHEVGSAGKFTAGVNYEGVPHFFKEDRVCRIYGSQPSKYSLSESEILGVEEGSGRSCAYVRGSLLYNSRAGICAYSGSTPTVISSAFGEERYTNAVGGSDGTKYYVSQKDARGGWHFFCYDSERGTWHREDDLHAVSMASEGAVLYIADSDGVIWMLGAEALPAGAAYEEEIESYVEFGDFYLGATNYKRLRKLRARVELDRGASVCAYLSSDGGEWIEQGEISAPLDSDGVRCCTMSLTPARCDRYRIKFEGRGSWRLSALTQEYSIGSDL